MKDIGYRGISYPFRINSKGGVTMSTTSNVDSTHIRESIEQVFKTNFLERPMEGGDIYTSVSMLLFEPNNMALQNVLRARIVDDLTRLDDRIEIQGEGVVFTVRENDISNEVYIQLTYRIKKFNTYYTSEIRIGDINEQNSE